MQKIAKPIILVIVGISGDLAKRKLLPALIKISAAEVLPEKFRVLGVSRRDFDASTLGHDDFIKDNLEVFKMDLADAAAYATLGERLKDIETGWDAPAERLFYLSIPPHAVRPVVEFMGAAGLNERGKLLLEKPFGVDLSSAEELIAEIGKYFPEDNVYRIDHYLAKEMTQNLVVFRTANSLFRRTWNNRFIERVQIMVSEKIGIEGRAAFYEQTGALRDFVQNHLLQLSALVAMKLPPDEDWSKIPAARAAALGQFKIKTRAGGFAAVRGQYHGYRQEVGNPKSTVETFAAITIESADPDWVGVPIELVTGKALSRKATEIRIYYRQEHANEANELVLRVGSEEGVSICLWTKKPGYDRAVERHPLDFSYSRHYEELPEAYERVFVDAMRSDHSLFSSGSEVLASWKIIEPLRRRWEERNDDLVIYENGESADEVLDRAA